MHQFTTSDGAAIAYSDTGGGRPILLLHGLMAHSGFFMEQAGLSDSCRLVAVDFRGHGASRAAQHRPSVERLARDVEELCAHLDLRQAIGVGWSLGASVLWRVLAGPCTSRFAGGVVVDMTPRVMNDADWQLGLTAERCNDRLAAMTSDYRAFATAAGEAIFAPGSIKDRRVADWAGREFAQNDGGSIAALWSSLVEEDFRPQLGRVHQPMLIVHGVQSHLYGPETASHLAQALPAAKAVPFEMSGHSPHIEEPDKFNRLLRDFEASLPAYGDEIITKTGER